MPLWEYAILTRQSAGLDTKWYVNRTYQHSETDLPNEVTDPAMHAYNEQFDQLHASKVYPVLPAILNLMGADGWELTGIQHTAPGQGYYIFKRPLADGAEPDLSVVRNGIVREQPGGGAQPGSGAGPQVTAL